MSSAAVAQRRQRQVHDIQPVEEVGPEPPGGDLPGQVTVRAGDDAHVDRLRPGGPDRPHLPFLDHPQQLGLEGHGQLGDLVEEERAAVGGDEEARVRLHGAGEGAADVAEELALEQGIGDGAAVDGHEPAVAAGARHVDGAGDQLLAGAALAGDQHVARSRRAAGDLLPHQAQSGRSRPPASPRPRSGRARGGRERPCARCWRRRRRCTQRARSCRTNGFWR